MHEIGGYFGLELKNEKEYYDNALKLNSGRNCLRYIIQKKNIKKIQIPAYTCPAIWEALKAEGCEIKYYDINSDMLPDSELDKECYVLYTNYFGICNRQIEIISKKYNKLIIDNAQGFFEKPKKTISFNSARKFFGVPDGAYLFGDFQYDDKLEKDRSYLRTGHLIKRLDSNAAEGYTEYKSNEELIDKEEPKRMSKLTKRLLSSVNYKECIRVRKNNFNYLHNSLKDINEFNIDTTNNIAMIYPLLLKNYNCKKDLKERLINEKIYLATYWKGQKDNGYGNILETYLLPLPIDQRYSQIDMDYMVCKIKNLI